MTSAVDPAAVDAAAAPVPGRPFARRVVSVFGSKLVVFGLALLSRVVVSGILEPKGQGAFYSVLMVPAMLGSIAVFGMPSAINYFSARGGSVRRMFATSTAFALGISAVVIAILWLTLPALEKNILSSAPGYLGSAKGDEMLRLIMLAVPAGMITSFVGSILYGRHEVKLYTAILVGQAAATPVILISLVGVLGLGVAGAVSGSIVVAWLGAAATIAAVWHVSRRYPGGIATPTKSLIGYGLRSYPAGMSGYFNYRADTFLIQALIINSAAPLGLYSTAVMMAEMIFYIPDAVTTIFLPTVAGSTPQQADAKLGRVSRLTVLVTVACSLLLIPVAWTGIHLVLPAYSDCLPAFLVLLPAVVSLSLAKVLTSYVAGRGRPGPISVAGLSTLILNLAANLTLIPILGIVGASLSSLISYTAMAVIMLIYVCRLSGYSPWQLIVPGKDEFRAVTVIVGQIGARAGARIRP